MMKDENIFYVMKRLDELHRSLKFVSQCSHWFYKFMNNSSKKNLKTVELHFQNPSILADHWLFGF